LNVLRKFTWGFLTVCLVVLLAALYSAPRALVNHSTVPTLGADPEYWLARSEKSTHAARPIIPGTEKRIYWQGGLKGRKAQYAVVYLHGFSATRQEIAPVGEMIADALDANLFETRLSGHGHERAPMTGVSAEAWLSDAAEALTVGAAIGDRIILMGTSTGATLALAMAGHPSFQAVSHLVLLSPNFAVSDPSSEFLTWPGGPQLAYLVAGTTRSWTPHNDLQARYWSTTYPMDAVIEMMRLVKFVRNQLPLQLDQALLTLYSPADTVVDVQRMLSALDEIDSPRKEILEIEGSDDPGNHVLAGDIMAPHNNELIVRTVTQFVKGHAAESP